MARDQAIVSLPVGVWTEVTNSNVTTISFQVLGGNVYLRYTTGASPSEEAGVIYQSMEGELAKTITSLVVLVGANRLFAKPVGGSPSRVWVDHA